MSEPTPLVHVVVENPNTTDCRVKAVFDTKENAEKAIEQEFSNPYSDTTYEIQTRSLLDDITE